MTDEKNRQELSDDELDAVSGGGCKNGREDAMWNDGLVTCNICGRVMPRSSVWLYTQNDDGSIICEACESEQIQDDIDRAYDMINERNR